MIPLPKVAIVGRPNVGKSSLLNRIARRRISIVDPKPGITRDRIAVEIEWKNTVFEAIDTGGIGIVDEEDLTGHIQSQIDLAIANADLVLFVLDSKEPLGRYDLQVAEKLRKTGRTCLLVGNKAEGVNFHAVQARSADLYKLGMGDPFLVSAKTGVGLDDLLDEIVKRLKKLDLTIKVPKKREEPMKIAIVGRRNAGKSTLVNFLAGEERVIVSEIPGTTRDAVDVQITKNGFDPFVVIDTAGVRKKKSMKESVEFYSLDRAEMAIRRCDVAFLLIDCTTDISDLDKKLARFVVDHFKPCIIVLSKWDLAKATTEAFQEYVRKKLHGLHFAPISLLSSKDGSNVWDTVKLAFDLHKQAGQRIGTGELNRVLDAARESRMPSVGGNLPKLFYGTQIGANPPTIVVFVNDPKYFGKDYDRFLQNRLREQLPFDEVPIRILYRKRDKVLLEERKK